MDIKVKGPPIQIFRWFFLSKLAKIKYARMEIAIKRIERVKNTFKYFLLNLESKNFIEK